MPSPKLIIITLNETYAKDTAVNMRFRANRIKSRDRLMSEWESTVKTHHEGGPRIR